MLGHITEPKESNPAVVALGYTKGGKHQGAAKSATIFRACGNTTSPSLGACGTHNHASLCPASHIWRDLFSAKESQEPVIS